MNKITDGKGSLISRVENIRKLGAKTKKFTEQNKTNLDQLLKPLGDKIKDFEKKAKRLCTHNIKFPVITNHE